jgi:predicted aldo/keto reductase-like oxidoreductase
MEPVKGGALANLPAEAEQLLKQIHPDDSAARWAIRFASDLDAVEIVLSGMNTMEQMNDNMDDLSALTSEERTALEEAASIIRGNTAIECTGCGYCTGGCPVGMPIPQFFTLFNEYTRHPGELWKTQTIYTSISNTKVAASDCIHCGQCERRCPQKLPVTDWLHKINITLSETSQ